MNINVFILYLNRSLLLLEKYSFFAIEADFIILNNAVWFLKSVKNRPEVPTAVQMGREGPRIPKRLPDPNKAAAQDEILDRQARRKILVLL